MSKTSMNHSKIFGGMYTFDEFTRLLRKDLKPKTLSLVKEIYYDTEELFAKNMTAEANESWSRLLQLDVFDTESENGDKDDIHIEENCVDNDKILSNLNEENVDYEGSYKNNVVKFKDGTDEEEILEALEWLKEMDELMEHGEFEEAFDVWSMILDMDVIEFSYGRIPATINMCSR